MIKISSILRLLENQKFKILENLHFYDSMYSKTRFKKKSLLHNVLLYLLVIITHFHNPLFSSLLRIDQFRTFTINNAHKSLPPSYLSLSVSDRCKWPRAPFNHNGFNFTSGGIVSRCSVIALTDATEWHSVFDPFEEKGKRVGPRLPSGRHVVELMTRDPMSPSRREADAKGHPHSRYYYYTGIDCCCSFIKDAF